MVAFMRDLGVTDFQAGGILGNLGWECAGFEDLVQSRAAVPGLLLPTQDTRFDGPYRA